MRFLLLFLTLFSCSTADSQSLGVYANPPKESKVEFDPNAPVVMLKGTIDTEHAGLFIEQLKRAMKSEPSVVTIVINSFGGSVEVGQLLAQLIETAPFKTVCIADQNADSMAFYILQSCSTRLMTKRAVLMAHQISADLDSAKAVTIRNQVESMDALDSANEEHEAARLKISLQEFRSHIANGHDWFMNWELALKVGAVDGIVDPRWIKSH